MTLRSLLELVFDYQLLRTKRDGLGVPLDEAESARLIGLGQLLTSDGDRGARTMPRLPWPSRVSFTLPGGFETGEVKNVSGRGLAIATSRPPAVGTRVIVRMADDACGAEYFFPCRVVWSRRTPLPGMGLAFDGVPTRSRLAGEDSGVWAATFPIGDRRKDVLAA